MSNNQSKLYDKIRGCMIGGLVGDAMGAPTERLTYKEIEEKFGEVSDFEGGGTDDSAIKAALCKAIYDNEGYVTADEFAASILETKDQFYNYYWVPVANMFHKIESKLCLPVYAGMGNMQSSSSAMGISPMGIINACNPRQAAIETFDVAGLIHAGESTFCRDGACAMAAAVAEAMSPNATVESVLDASTAYLHKTSSAEMISVIGSVLSLAKETKDYKVFREKFYETYLMDIISDSRETVPCVLALFYLAEGDPIKSIVYGANFGRDSDTIATMVGAMAGAFKGSIGLKPEWIEKVEINNPEYKETISKLTKVTISRIEKIKARIDLFEALI